jgi:hypothetical protein
LGLNRRGPDGRLAEIPVENFTSIAFVHGKRIEESESSIKVRINDKMKSYFEYHRENVYLG